MDNGCRSQLIVARVTTGERSRRTSSGTIKLPDLADERALGRGALCWWAASAVPSLTAGRSG